MSDADLATRELANVVALWGAFPHVDPGSTFGRDGPVAWATSGVALGFLNQIVVDGAAATPAHVDHAVREMREVGLPFTVRLRIGIDDPLLPAFERLGLREGDEQLPGMAMHPLDERAMRAAASLPGFTVRRAADAMGLGDVHAVVAAGFEMADEDARAMVPDVALRLPGLAILAGYVGNHPVATALAWTAGDTVGVYGVTTVRAHRRRGYGAALTNAAIVHGLDAGASLATLQASPMGKGVYERMGFREVVRYRILTEE